MTKFNKSQVQDRAREILGDKPQGVRWAKLVNTIKALGPETPIGTITGSLRELRKLHKEIARPSKGLWVLTKYIDVEKSLDAAVGGVAPQADNSGGSNGNVTEAAFYEPFKEWLCEETDEAVEALVLGGAVFKSKWGTPDVIGVNKPRSSDPVDFLPTEIVSAEIKIDPGQAVTAFGQACAYRLFSHKVYVVMPRTLPTEDRDRLETLCGLFGVGYVEFDASVEIPAFEMRVRAQRFEPDRFYVNSMAERLKSFSKADFDRLF
jgi:hypothetical protein